MRIDQLCVRPRLRIRLQLLRRHLPRRQQHLPHLAVYLIAIDVGVVKFVVRADELYLPIHAGQRAIIPKAYVVNRLRVAPDYIGVHRGFGGIELLLDAVQRKRVARELDIALDIGRLALKLIRVHRELLYESGPNIRQHDVHHEPQRKRPYKQPPAAEVGVRQHQQARGCRDDRHYQQRRHPRVHIRVRRAEHRAVSGKQQVVSAEPMPPSDGEHNQRRDYGQVYLDAGQRQIKALPLHAHAQEVDSRRRQQNHHQHRQQPALNETEHRQREHIERHIPPENRIHLVKRDGVGKAQEHLPARRHDAAENHGQHDYRHHADANQRAAHKVKQLVRQRQRHIPARKPQRRVHARAQQQRHRHHARREQAYPRKQHRHEYAPIAQVVKPQPVGIDAAPEHNKRKQRDRHNRYRYPLGERAYLPKELVEIFGRIAVATVAVLVFTSH